MMNKGSWVIWEKIAKAVEVGTCQKSLVSM